MSRQYTRMGIERKESVQRQHHLVRTMLESLTQRRLPALEVRSANASAEEGVSGDEHLVEQEAATPLGMAGGVDALALR